MFDFGFGEILLLATVALVVLGPERLPHVARLAGAWVGRIRRTMTDIQAELEQEVAVQEMRSSLRKQMQTAGTQELREQVQAQLQLIEDSLKSGSSGNRDVRHPPP